MGLSRPVITQIYLFFFVFQIAGFSQASSNKLALSIAISQYAEDSGWSSLNAYNDIPLIRHALIQQGFKAENIFSLENELASREGILKAIESQLIQKARRGDLVYFHFSGHGQQVQDNNGDELDGLDEAIVPFDSQLRYEKGVYEGENLIRDEELGKILLRLRKKLGRKGQVIVILDACHSGTGTRGYRTARGTDIVMADSMFLKEFQNTKEKVHYEEAFGKNQKNLAPMVAFFGSSAHQLNYETITDNGQYVGSLSYAFSRAFSEARKEDSFQAVFEKIKLLMTTLVPGQNPQAEGNLNRTISEGKLLGKATYFKLCENGWIDEQQVCMNGGTLAGVFEGSTVHFHQPDTRYPKDHAPISTGKVIRATPFSSIVQLETVLEASVAQEAWIFIHNRHFGEIKVGLQLDIKDVALKNSLVEKIEAFPVIKLVEEKADLILKSQTDSGSRGSIQLIASTEQIIYEATKIKNRVVLANRIIKKILDHIQAKFLRNFEMKNGWLDVRMELIPIGKSLDRQNHSAFQVSDTFQIRVSNHGFSGAYYAILDIQPDNKINSVIPLRGDTRTPEEYYLPSGESYVIETNFIIAPPYGTEVLKLIATKSPMNLGAITRGENIDENPHPFEQIFKHSYFYETRGQDTQNFSISPVLSIDTVVFEIVEK